MRLPPQESELFVLARRPLEFVDRYRFALVLLFMGALADAVTTIEALQRFGAEAEFHLAQRLIVHVLGVWAGVPVAKLTQLGFAILVAAWWRPWCRWILGGCGVLYGLAAISNHFVLF